jgi:hypothetical protein
MPGMLTECMAPAAMPIGTVQRSPSRPSWQEQNASTSVSKHEFVLQKETVTIRPLSVRPTTG